MVFCDWGTSLTSGSMSSRFSVWQLSFLLGAEYCPTWVCVFSCGGTRAPLPLAAGITRRGRICAQICNGHVLCNVPLCEGLRDSSPAAVGAHPRPGRGRPWFQPRREKGTFPGTPMERPALTTVPESSRAVQKRPTHPGTFERLFSSGFGGALGRPWAGSF